MKVFTILLLSGLSLSQMVMSMPYAAVGEPHDDAVTNKLKACIDTYHQDIANLSPDSDTYSDSWNTALFKYEDCLGGDVENLEFAELLSSAVLHDLQLSLDELSKQTKQSLLLAKLSTYRLNGAMKSLCGHFLELSLDMTDICELETGLSKSIDALRQIILEEAQPTEDALRLATMGGKEFREAPGLVQEAEIFIGLVDRLDKIEKNMLAIHEQFEHLSVPESLAGTPLILLHDANELFNGLVDDLQRTFSLSAEVTNADMPEAAASTAGKSIMVSGKGEAFLRSDLAGPGHRGEQALAEIFDFAGEYLHEICSREKEYPWEAIIQELGIVEGDEMEKLEEGELRALVKSQWCK